MWSKREKTEAGAPLAQLVEHGISRVKYACDVVDALIKEIKTLSHNKQCVCTVDFINVYAICVMQRVRV